MKTKLLLIMLFFTCMIYSQKSKSGTVYNEHPAIKLVEAMQQAFVKADTIALANYLADDFKGFNGFISYADKMSPLGNATADDCADYTVTLFSDLTKKVTMQNLFHDGGFSNTGVSQEVIDEFSK